MSTFQPVKNFDDDSSSNAAGADLPVADSGHPHEHHTEMSMATPSTTRAMALLLVLALLAVARGQSDSAWPSTNIKRLNAEIDRCTTIIVGKKAGVAGPMNTHTADCSDCDFRINKVPAMDWEDGAQRPLYLYKGDYPSLVSSERGNTWLPSNLEGTDLQKAAWGEESAVTGYIPQVKHTYALFEAGYGIMNEHQLAIGESTCASRFWAAPTSAGGKAMIEARMLSQIALERTRTAREAIALMGQLAEEYGFYAADWSGGDASKGEGGEALTVIDKEEAWVFHVLSDDTGTSAVWAAQRVPDDHIAAVANQFVIREIDPSSGDFLYSKNIFDVARRQSLWSEEKGKLDFLKTYAPPRAHSAYATRRVWRVFDLAAPSAGVPAFTDAYGSDYPFSAKIDKPLEAADLMRIQRDHYEGSQFDLTKGLAAGPYGDPNRFDMAAQPADNLTMLDIIQGSYERSISLFRTSYSFVAQARQVDDLLALLWFAQYAPSSSSYAPLYLCTSLVPVSYTRGSLHKYDSSVAFWNFLAAGNYAGRFYKFAMADVKDLQLRLQEDSAKAVQAVEQKVVPMLAASTYTTPAAVALLTATTNEQALLILLGWRNLLPALITKYHDGYTATQLNEPTLKMVKMFYPKFWLDATGFFSSKINTGPDTILFASDSTSAGGAGALVITALVSSLVSALGGFALAKYYDRRYMYLPLK